MKKRTGIILLVGFCLIILGTGLAFAGYFGGASTRVLVGRHGIRIPEEVDVAPYTTQVDEFTSIHVDVYAASISNVTIAEGSDFSVSYQPGKGTHLAYENSPDPEDMFEVKDGELSVKYSAGNSWEDGMWEIGGSPFDVLTGDQIVITVPKGTQLTSVDGGLDASSLTVTSIKTQNLAIAVDLGGITLDGCTVGAGDITSDSGRIALTSVKCDGALTINSDLGSTSLEKCDVGTLAFEGSSGKVEVADSTISQSGSIENDLGAVNVTNSTCKDLSVRNDSGGILMTGTFTGATQVVNDLGAITIQTSLPREQYKFMLSNDLGSTTVNGAKAVGDLGNSAAPNSIEATNSSGSISIECAR